MKIKMGPGATFHAVIGWSVCKVSGWVLSQHYTVNRYWASFPTLSSHLFGTAPSFGTSPSLGPTLLWPSPPVKGLSRSWGFLLLCICLTWHSSWQPVQSFGITKQFRFPHSHTPSPTPAQLFPSFVPGQPLIALNIPLEQETRQVCGQPRIYCHHQSLASYCIWNVMFYPLLYPYVCFISFGIPAGF